MMNIKIMLVAAGLIGSFNLVNMAYASDCSAELTAYNNARHKYNQECAFQPLRNNTKCKNLFANQQGEERDYNQCINLSNDKAKDAK